MNHPPQSADAEQSWRLAGMIGLVAGPMCAAALYFFLPDNDPLLSHAAKATAAVGLLMAIWWMTEAVPLEATSLLPLVLFPLLMVYAGGKEGALQRAAMPYANASVFLYLGGFLIALAVERWGLHRRVALLTLLAVGTRPARLVAGVMLATAVLSMWISNTATALMMLPIGLSVVGLMRETKKGTQAIEPPAAAAPGRPAIDLAPDNTTDLQADRNFAVCLMLGIAYAASIGGLGTLIGTPPNVFFAGFMDDKGLPIDFGRWMAFAVPLLVVYLIICWWLLTKVLFPLHADEVAGGRQLIRGELKRLGPMSRGEWIVLAVFLATAVSWIGRGPLSASTWGRRQPWLAGLDDAWIAMAGAVLLFLIPVEPRRGRFALDWSVTTRLPWGVLLLFGGGLSLAAAMTDTGLAKWLSEQMRFLHGMPTPVVIVLVVAGVVLFSELASNLATAAALLPLLFEVARGMQIDPLLLAVPTIVAASCGFMLPVATPPNAIVFGAGHVTMRQMMRAGFWLDLVAVVLVPVAVYTLGRWTLGIKV